MAKRKRNKLINIIGILFLLSSLLMLVIYYQEKAKIDIKETEQIEEFIENTNHDNETVVEERKENIEAQSPNISYSMVLEIPKINLKKGIYDKYSKYNNVSYNIQLLKESDTPAVTNGKVLFAGHNGSSSVSFFNKLYKLKASDIVNIYYDGIKYSYIIDKIYDIKKTGTASISRDHNKSTVVLITCKKNTKDTQTVYVGYLSSQSKY